MFSPIPAFSHLLRFSPDRSLPPHLRFQADDCREAGDVPTSEPDGSAGLRGSEAVWRWAPRTKVFEAHLPFWCNHG